MASPAEPDDVGPPVHPARHRAPSTGVPLSPSPICMVDLQRDLICSSSSPWSDVGLVLPANRRLSTAVHPDDAERVRAFLADAPTTPLRKPAVTMARLRAPGGWRETRIAALRVDGLLEDAEVMVRLS